jgi:NAD-dependent DNA ligase
MSRASRGISIIWVILTVALALGASVTAFLQYLEVANHKEWKKRAETEAAAFEKERRDVGFREIQEVCILCGFKFEQESDIEKTLGALKDRVDAKKTQYALPGKAMAMWEIIHAAEINYEVALHRNVTAKQFKAESESAMKSSQDVLANYGRLKDEEINELQANLTKVTDVQTEDVRRYELRKSTLEAEVTKLTQAKTDLTKAQNAETLDLNNKVNSVDTALRELVKQEAIFHDLTEVQGRIVDPHQDEKYAFINLGARDRLVRGLKLIVFVREPGGNVRWKGEVEVKDIFAESAKVSITETVDRFDPIIEGDVVFNPVFSPSRPRKVAFVGEFTKTKYSKEQAANRIRNIGSIVQDAVNDETDFVIVGESYQSDPNFEKAQLLSVPWRPHFEIFRFLGD